tara:strand:+ start:1426 stop:1665 length:240 start_codon:yes stop_codon:yes gene_type:complete
MEKTMRQPIDIIALWELYPIDDYPKIYKVRLKDNPKTKDDYLDVTDAHKKAKSVYDALSTEDKKTITNEWIIEEINKNI